MRLAIQQRFHGGPLDGETRWRVFDQQNLIDALHSNVPCSFDGDVPTRCAWYAANLDDSEMIVGGRVDLFFEDYILPTELQKFVYGRTHA